MRKQLGSPRRVAACNNVRRCCWVTADPMYIDYHDHEWGVPTRDEQTLFEFLILEGMQAGLSWLLILKKRENYRKAFDQFNAEKIAGYGPAKIKELLENPGIIRNRLKVESVIRNAQAYLKLKEQGISLSDYLWGFVGGQPIQNSWSNQHPPVCFSAVSDRMAKDLKKCGFTFVGTKICYSLMQAVGMVNDHAIECFRHGAVKKPNQFS